MASSSTPSTTQGSSVFRLSAIALIAVNVGLIGFFGWVLYSRNQVYRLRIATSPKQSENYILMDAFKQVVERHHPNIRLELVPTSGTSESLEKLDKGETQLAAAQADIPPPAIARLMVTLYPDMFQLLVTERVNIQRFTDLKGKRIGLQTKGGQYRTFLEIAAHFGLQDRDFFFVGNTEEEANLALRTGGADAIFRVRAPGYRPIADLVRSSRVRLLPIEQARALQLKFPAFQPTVIPTGTYRGLPALPERDLPTIAVDRLLLVREDVPETAVRLLTEVAIERRQEIANAVPPELMDVRPLALQFRAPRGDETPTALHGGAIAYYERDKPSFVQEYADYVALIMTVMALLWSWAVEFKNWLEQRQKNHADAYSQQAIDVIQACRTATDLKLLEAQRLLLLDILTKAVQDLDRDDISEESFQSFRVVWQIALDVVRERRVALLQSPKSQNTEARLPAPQAPPTMLQP
ncbi:MAG TPA: TRAP transporter substrate-binding protein [Cyanobacteria bacterium UBA8156]|jgi:TRAP transporter TAXI family solute receptor|nr:TRAP transporter substrate-binding protein [Cyanobacteria bacterium UBA8156]